MNLKYIYLDMDGVCSDWASKVVFELSEFDCIDEFNKHPDSLKIQQDIYKKYPNVFRELDIIQPFIEFSEYLVYAVNELGCKLNILSAIGNTHHCPKTVQEDKYDWIENNLHKLGLEFDNIYLVGQSADKCKYANPRSILVDDYDKNCIQFTDSGGHSLHMGELGLYDPHQKGNELIELVDKVMRSIR